MNERLRRANINKALRTNRIPESTIQHQVEAYLALKGVTVLRVPDAVLAMIARTGSPQARAMVSRHFMGQPDIIALWPDGTFLGIELKAEDGKLSQGQINWWKRLGQPPNVCRSFEEAKEQIDWQHGRYVIRGAIAKGET